MVFADSQKVMCLFLSIAYLRQIHTPVGVPGNPHGRPILDLASQHLNLVLVFCQRCRNPGFADGHALIGKEAIKMAGEGSAPVSGQVGFEAKNFLDHPVGLFLYTDRAGGYYITTSRP